MDNDENDDNDNDNNSSEIFDYTPIKRLPKQFLPGMEAFAESKSDN